MLSGPTLAEAVDGPVRTLSRRNRRVLCAPVAEAVARSRARSRLPAQPSASIRTRSVTHNPWLAERHPELRIHRVHGLSVQFHVGVEFGRARASRSATPGKLA